MLFIVARLTFLLHLSQCAYVMLN